MAAENQTDVLVVGAGPVGLFTACTLSRHGVQVRIIDGKPGIEAQSDACLLHSRSFSILNHLGLGREISEAGRRVDKVSFYEGLNRRAEVNLAGLNTEFPFQIVRKSELKEALKARLREAGIQVDWSHRLAELEVGSEHVDATIEELAISAKGYIIPEMDWEVKKTEQLKAKYVLGADGDESKVAQVLGMGYERTGVPESYLIFELECDWPVRDEICVILDPGTTSMLWPLSGSTVRWSFQVPNEQLRRFPFKERSSIWFEQPAVDQANREFIASLVQERAPWFTGSLGDLHWSTHAEFDRGLASRVGDGRCWLLGDAAHVTNPAGMQSMNCGLAEAEQLAGILSGVLHGTSGAEALHEFGRTCREEWQALLGMSAALQPKDDTTPWVRDRAARILSCIPASGSELRQAASQLSLDFSSREMFAAR